MMMVSKNTIVNGIEWLQFILRIFVFGSIVIVSVDGLSVWFLLVRDGVSKLTSVLVLLFPLILKLECKRRPFSNSFKYIARNHVL